MKSDRAVGEGMDGQPDRVEGNGGQMAGRWGGTATEELVDTVTFNGGLTAVSGVTCRGDKLTYASGSAGDMRGGVRRGVTSLPALTLVLHTALPCVKIVDLFLNA